MLAGGVIATGLTILTTAITSDRAVHEQYTKEANLERKRDVYGPLHSELKAAREQLESALHREQAVPQWINIGATYPQPVTFGYTPPRLLLWPEFKRDYRVDNFSDATQSLLDRVWSVAGGYNAQVLAIRVTCRDLLRQRLELALQQTVSSPEYTQWFDHVTRGTGEVGTIRRDEVTPTAHDWLYRLVFAPPDLASVWANGWLDSWPVQQQPSTLGWLLGGSLDEAADAVYGGFTWATTEAPPPRTWVEQILSEMYQDAEKGDVFRKPRETFQDLVILLRQAEDQMARALRQIRDRYEGGEPLV